MPRGRVDSRSHSDQVMRSSSARQKACVGVNKPTMEWTPGHAKRNRPPSGERPRRLSRLAAEHLAQQYTLRRESCAKPPRQFQGLRGCPNLNQYPQQDAPLKTPRRTLRAGTLNGRFWTYAVLPLRYNRRVLPKTGRVVRGTTAKAYGFS